MTKEKCICPNCNKFLTPYISSSDLCQLCYRKLLDRYSFYEIKDNIGLPNEKTKARKIINMTLYDKKETNEIAESLSVSKTYVRQIRERYLYKCDCNGVAKPKYLRIRD